MFIVKKQPMRIARTAARTLYFMMATGGIVKSRIQCKKGTSNVWEQIQCSYILIAGLHILKN